MSDDKLKENFYYVVKTILEILKRDKEKSLSGKLCRDLGYLDSVENRAAIKTLTMLATPMGMMLGNVLYDIAQYQKSKQTIIIPH